ncbi:paraquat-inducible protein A [Marinobacterium jannaschii]|uniref:paraquat-inducible protein A n=1 Tax=Marinobacterium jannaschii TaxID=64970 RepID=UPI0006843A78|nr:paraquat-inducible protein A [Marinobacterium jannaschii]
MNKALAFSSSALLFLLLANLFPFLAFRAQGREQVMNLLHSSFELATQGHPVLAALVAVFILLIPALMLSTLLYLLIPLKRGRYPHNGYRVCRYLFTLKPWSMVEVFLIGVLVSLIKIASMADVILGISFWAYVLFSLCLTAAISAIDRHHLWIWLEHAHANRK